MNACLFLVNIHDFHLSALVRIISKNVRLQVGGLNEISRSYLDLDHIECGETVRIKEHIKKHAYMKV